MNRLNYTFLLIIIFQCLGMSQTKDQVLFTVAGEPVNVSEFKYIYEKTNGEKADYSERSVNEYLELYKKFKLKVAKAKEMRLDTITSLKNELEGYRKQLANSYLIDKEVTEQLTKEAYDRSLKDIDISHIMVLIPKNPSPTDTLAAYTKIKGLKKELDAGADFVTLAKTKSDDKTAVENGGRIGFVNAMLPNGFYQMETAAYTTPVGQYSDIVRTKAGYHIIKVNQKRDARGEMDAAHILIRKKKKDRVVKNAKARIDSIYQAILDGASFTELARSLSEDQQSAPKGGSVGTFGINRYEKNFEDTAFGLAKDGDIAAPIETTVGWHIIKRIQKKPKAEYSIMRGRLQSKIKRDERYEMAKAAMIQRIKDDNNFVESDKAFDQFIRTLDVSYLSYKYKPNTDVTKKVLFSIGDENFTQVDFAKFSADQSRKRMQIGRDGDIEQTARTLYEDFVKASALAYEERQLETKYPEFKSLMREYEEGILLFEATKILVWDRASQDSVGLANYFDKLKGRGKYLWDDRAEVTFYKLKAGNEKMIDKVRDAAKNKSVTEMMDKFNKKEEILTARTEVIEKGKNKVLDALDWKAGTLSANEVSKRDKSTNFMKIEKVIPPSEKTIDEARGYIVADYQDYLEKNWIQELAQEYDISVNAKALKKLIKK